MGKSIWDRFVFLWPAWRFAKPIHPIIWLPASAKSGLTMDAGVVTMLDTVAMVLLAAFAIDTRAAG